MKNFYIGFDIGGTKIDAGLVQGGKILKRKVVKTPKDKKVFTAAVFGIIRELAGGRESSVRGVGVAMAGVIDGKSGRVVKSPNIPKLDGLNLKKAIESEFKIPVRVDNDAKCFLRAETKFGAARKAKNAVGLILGTGIGAGIMIDGKIYYGRDGGAGELGHTIISAGSGFKRLANLEDLASKKGFLRFGVKDVQKLAERAKRGDKNSLKIFGIVGGYLGIGLANAINTLNPEIIVMGGGLANVSRYLIKPAKKMIQKLVLAPKAKNTPIIISKSGDKAGILGAILLFLK